MVTIRQDGFRLLHASGGIGLFAAAFSRASAADHDAMSGSEMLPLVMGAVGLIAGITSLLIALRGRSLATSALQEAGEARAKAQATGQPLSVEALAATEKVWSARINALEAQIQHSQPRNGVRSAAAADRHATSELTTRLDEVERALAGLSASVAQNRRSAPTASPVPPAPELPWPLILRTEKSGIKELRDLLQEGSKVLPDELKTLFHELNTAERWSGQRRPSLDEVLSFLQELSQAFHTLLRKGASQPAHEGSRMADRLLAILRPVWQAQFPTVDCRIFYPGTPFDPEWMEDQNPSAARRPTISEMYSWAVHEKNKSGRKIIAKARVSSE
jgi:hypothetical protein